MSPRGIHRVIRAWLANATTLAVAIGGLAVLDGVNAHASAPEQTQVLVSPAVALKTQTEIARDAVDRFILPRIATFKARSEALSQAVAKLCTEAVGEVKAARDTAQSAFVETVRAWAPLDMIRFGPSAREHRLERILFWPDPRAIAERQLNGLLAARNAELLKPGALTTQSVAVQGLTALEYLLFDDRKPLGGGDDEAGRYRCGMAAAIAASIDTVAGEIESGWQGDAGHRAKILNPGPDNVLYRDTAESAREIAKALVLGFDLVRDRIALPELAAIARDPPRRARLPFERAGATGAFVHATIRALKDLYDTCGFAARIGPDKKWMANFLTTGWDGLIKESQRLDEVRAGQVGSEDHLHVVRKLRFDITSIRQIVVKELAANAGIILGFNELDGD